MLFLVCIVLWKFFQYPVELKISNDKRKKKRTDGGKVEIMSGDFIYERGPEAEIESGR